MNGDCSANPRPLPDTAMFLKTKQQDGDPRRQLCACPCDGVQICKGKRWSGEKITPYMACDGENIAMFRTDCRLYSQPQNMGTRFLVSHTPSPPWHMRQGGDGTSM